MDEDFAIELLQSPAGAAAAAASSLQQESADVSHRMDDILQQYLSQVQCINDTEMDTVQNTFLETTSALLSANGTQSQAIKTAIADALAIQRKLPLVQADVAMVQAARAYASAAAPIFACMAEDKAPSVERFIALSERIKAMPAAARLARSDAPAFAERLHHEILPARVFLAQAAWQLLCGQPAGTRLVLAEVSHILACAHAVGCLRPVLALCQFHACQALCLACAGSGSLAQLAASITGPSQGWAEWLVQFHAAWKQQSEFLCLLGRAVEFATLQPGLLCQRDEFHALSSEHLDDIVQGLGWDSVQCGQLRRFMKASGGQVEPSQAAAECVRFADLPMAGASTLAAVAAGTQELLPCDELSEADRQLLATPPCVLLWSQFASANALWLAALCAMFQPLPADSPRHRAHGSGAGASAGQWPEALVWRNIADAWDSIFRRHVWRNSAPLPAAGVVDLGSLCRCSGITGQPARAVAIAHASLHPLASVLYAKLYHQIWYTDHVAWSFDTELCAVTHQLPGTLQAALRPLFQPSSTLSSGQTGQLAQLLFHGVSTSTDFVLGCGQFAAALRDQHSSRSRQLPALPSFSAIKSLCHAIAVPARVCAGFQAPQSLLARARGQALWCMAAVCAAFARPVPGAVFLAEEFAAAGRSGWSTAAGWSCQLVQAVSSEPTRFESLPGFSQLIFDPAFGMDMEVLVRSVLDSAERAAAGTAVARLLQLYTGLTHVPVSMLQGDTVARPAWGWGDSAGAARAGSASTPALPRVVLEFWQCTVYELLGAVLQGPLRCAERCVLSLFGSDAPHAWPGAPAPAEGAGSPSPSPAIATFAHVISQLFSSKVWAALPPDQDVERRLRAHIAQHLCSVISIVTAARVAPAAQCEVDAQGLVGALRRAADSGDTSAKLPDARCWQQVHTVVQLKRLAPVQLMESADWAVLPGSWQPVLLLSSLLVQLGRSRAWHVPEAEHGKLAQHQARLVWRSAWRRLSAWRPSAHVGQAGQASGTSHLSPSLRGSVWRAVMSPQIPWVLSPAPYAAWMSSMIPSAVLAQPQFAAVAQKLQLTASG